MIPKAQATKAKTDKGSYIKLTSVHPRTQVKKPMAEKEETYVNLISD